MELLICAPWGEKGRRGLRRHHILRQDEVPVETADTAQRGAPAQVVTEGSTLEKLGPAFPMITFSHLGGKRANQDARSYGRWKLTPAGGSGRADG